MEYSREIKEFLDYLKQLNYRHRTIRGIQYALTTFGQYLAENHITDLLKVDREDILNYLTDIEKRFTLETQKIKISAVKSLFTSLQEKKRLFINPMEGLSLPKRKKSPPRIILTAKEVEQLIQAPNISLPEGIRDRALLELLYSTGIRLEETVILNTEDIDLKGGSLIIRGKGGKERIIPAGKKAIHILKEYITAVRPLFENTRNKESALFISINGERLGTYWVSSTLKEYACQAKIKKPVTPHVIRHTMASHLLLGGAPIEIVQRILGHENINTTTIYTRVFPVDVKTTHTQTHPRERQAGKPGS